MKKTLNKTRKRETVSYNKTIGAFQTWGRLHANVIDYNYNYFGIP